MPVPVSSLATEKTSAATAEKLPATARIMMFQEERRACSDRQVALRISSVFAFDIR